MTAQRALTLWIQTSSCRCGQRWTHSYCTYTNGGTPTPADEDKLVPTQIIPSRRNHSHCYRCVPLGLSIGWQKPGDSRATTSTPEGVQPPAPTANAKDLLA